jgi:hypothetical protein
VLAADAPSVTTLYKQFSLDKEGDFSVAKLKTGFVRDDGVRVATVQSCSVLYIDDDDSLVEVFGEPKEPVSASAAKRARHEPSAASEQRDPTIKKKTKTAPRTKEASGRHAG